MINIKSTMLAMLIALAVSGCSKSDAQQVNDARKNETEAKKAPTKEEMEAQLIRVAKTNDNNNEIGSINKAISISMSNRLTETNRWRDMEKEAGIKLAPLDYISPFKILDLNPKGCRKLDDLKFICKADFTIDLKGYKKEAKDFEYRLEVSWAGLPEVTIR